MPAPTAGPTGGVLPLLNASGILVSANHTGNVPVEIPDSTRVFNSTLLYFALVAISLALYSITRKTCPSVMAPRLEARRQSRPAQRKCFSLKDIDFSWAWKAMSLREDDLIRLAGLDGYIVIRIIRFCWCLSAGFCLIAVVFLLPTYCGAAFSKECSDFCEDLAKEATNYASDGDPNQIWADRATCVCTPIDRASLATIPPGKEALWMPVLVLMMMTALTLYASAREYKSVVRIQQKSWEKLPQAHTVLVEEVPERLRDRSGVLLHNYFSRIVPDEILYVEPIDASSQEFLALREVGDERNYVLWKLERVKAMRQDANYKKLCCASVPSAERVLELERDLEILNERFRLRKESYLAFERAGQDVEAQPPDDNASNSHAYTETSALLNEDDDLHFSAAFVTFRGLVPSAMLSQSRLDNASDMHVSTAPHPLDIIWENLGMGTLARASRRTVAQFIFYLIILFWGFFTSFVGASTSTRALARQFPAVRTLLTENPSLGNYLDQFAPLVLVLLVSIVYPLMNQLSRVEGRVSQSEADKRTLERYFAFLVIQVFLFYSVAGTVFKTFVEILQEPRKIVDTLGSTIPQNASFYIQFIVVKLFWMLSCELLRVVDIFLAVSRRLVAGPPLTNRERISQFCGCFTIFYPSATSISSTLAQTLLVFFIALVYAVIQPLILPAAFVFFALGNVVYTTILTTSGKPTYKSGGQLWWPTAYWCIVIGLLTAQLTLVGVLYIKQGFRQTVPTWLLVIATSVAAFNIETRYGPRVSKLSARLASQIDHSRRGLEVHRIQPSVWQYGAIRPGQPIEEGTIAVFTYRHPLLNEQAQAQPSVHNLFAILDENGQGLEGSEAINGKAVARRTGLYGSING